MHVSSLRYMMEAGIHGGYEWWFEVLLNKLSAIIVSSQMKQWYNCDKAVVIKQITYHKRRE